MSNSREILKSFYAAVVKGDFVAARRHLQDDLVFVGLFETYSSADSYLTALKGLMSITVRLDIKRIVAEESDAAIFFDLETRAPAEATVLVAEWHQIKDGKIWHVQSAFDGRPYESMFTKKPASRTG